MLINRPWKRKKGERWTSSANSFTKIDQLDGFRLLSRSGMRKFRTLQEQIRLHDLLNCARSRAEKKMTSGINMRDKKRMCTTRK